MTIHYLEGDAINPPGDGPKIIAHIVNDIGRWGSGFVVPLMQKWPTTREAYLEWAGKPADSPQARANAFYFLEGTVLMLGAVQFVRVETSPPVWVANMCGQHRVRSSTYTTPIRYEAVEECLVKVREEALALEATVHMPRIGCGLAGGRWSWIEEIINDVLPDVEVFVHDPPGNRFNP